MVLPNVDVFLFTCVYLIIYIVYLIICDQHYLEGPFRIVEMHLLPFPLVLALQYDGHSPHPTCPSTDLYCEEVRGQYLTTSVSLQRALGSVVRLWCLLDSTVIFRHLTQMYGGD